MGFMKELHYCLEDSPCVVEAQLENIFGDWGFVEEVTTPKAIDNVPEPCYSAEEIEELFAPDPMALDWVTAMWG